MTNILVRTLPVSLPRMVHMFRLGMIWTAFLVMVAVAETASAALMLSDFAVFSGKRALDRRP